MIRSMMGKRRQRGVGRKMDKGERGKYGREKQLRGRCDKEKQDGQKWKEDVGGEK